MCRTPLKHLFASIVGSLVLFTLIGCGSGSPGVHGTVTLDNAPVDGGLILFFPEGQTGVPDKGHGDIKEGKYKVEDASKLTPGNYRVEIYWQKKTGKKVVSKNDPPNMEEETIQVVPDKYNKGSQLKAEVKAGSNKLDYSLTSK